MLGRPGGRTALEPRDLLPLAVTALVGVVALGVSRLLPSTDPLFSIPGLIPELIALLARAAGPGRDPGA